MSDNVSILSRLSVLQLPRPQKILVRRRPIFQQVVDGAAVAVGGPVAGV